MVTQRSLFALDTSTRRLCCVYCWRVYVCALGYTATECPACGGELE